MSEQVSKRCDTCGSDDGRYCCPGCSKRSCSLVCVNSHKQLTGCTGRRSVTQFVSLSDYNDSTLLSDYFFLENAVRFSDSTSRDKIKMFSNQSWKRTKNMSRLKGLARNRGINLFLAPIGLSSHQLNTSHVSFNSQTNTQSINWKIQWHFIDSSLEYVDRSVSEYSTLESLLDKYIHPTNSDPLIRHRLRQYVASYERVKIFMKVERAKGKNRYYQLEKGTSLGDNLKGKLIIEHPILWVTCSSETELQFPQQLQQNVSITSEGHQEISDCHNSTTALEMISLYSDND